VLLIQRRKKLLLLLRQDQVIEADDVLFVYSHEDKLREFIEKAVSNGKRDLTLNDIEVIGIVVALFLLSAGLIFMCQKADEILMNLLYIASRHCRQLFAGISCYCTSETGVVQMTALSASDWAIFACPSVACQTAWGIIARVYQGEHTFLTPVVRPVETFFISRCWNTPW